MKKKLTLIDHYDNRHGKTYCTKQYNYTTGDSVDIPSDVYNRAHNKVSITGSYIDGIINGDQVRVFKDIIK